MISRTSRPSSRRKPLVVLGVFALAAICLAGCGRDGEEPMTPASRPVTVDNERGIFALAAERCDREARCGNVGPNEDYTSRNDCMARIESDARDDLDARECPGGIEQRELDECVQQVRSEDCGHVLDKLERLAECADSQLCLD
jgi:hypothetical protein